MKYENDENFITFSTFFNSIFKIDKEILFNYYKEWEEITCPAKYILTDVGQIQSNMLFVLEGVQKSYQISNEKEHILEFTYFPSLSGIPDSFIMQTPSKYILETISNSRFLKIPYRRHIEFLSKFNELNTLFRKITEIILFNVIDRHYDMSTLDMKERFITLVNKRPELLYLVPRKDLASYLRIDPTNLSKLIKSVKL